MIDECKKIVNTIKLIKERCHVYRKNSLKVACHYTRYMVLKDNATVWTYFGHISGTHLLTRLVQHATLGESGPTRACSYTRDNPWSLIVGCQKYVIILPMIRLEEHAQMMWHAWSTYSGMLY